MPPHKELRAYGINVVIENIFNDDFTAIISQYAIDFVKNPGKVLVLCDGHKKPLEFRCFAPLIKPGDILMAHDYAETDEKFKREKLWPSYEVCEADVADLCIKHNLLSCNKEKFDSVVWLCKKKVM
jgi:hypothetical protein